jgi:hypothetical protein
MSPPIGIGLGLAPTLLWGVSRAAPSAPVLSLNSAVAGLLTFLWDIDDTVAAGDTLNRQVATDSGFSTIIDTTSRTISSGDDAANQITASQYQAPANGTYYVRGSVTSATTGKTSAWSNTVTVVVSDIVSNRIMLDVDQILWGSDRILWS